VLEIVVVGDVHGEGERLGRTLELVRGVRPALTVLVGDVGLDPPWGEERIPGRAQHDASVARVLGTMHEAFGAPVAWVPGNHDLRDPPPHASATNCDGKRSSLAGFSIVGLGGAGPTKFGFAYEWIEKEAYAALRPLVVLDAPIDLFVTHTPPRSTALDRTYRGMHVGSRAVRSFVARTRPGLVLCGHIHEAWGAITLDGVPCVNAGALGVPYAQEIVWRIAWDGSAPAEVRSLRRLEDGTVEDKTW
jgi:uncharacterized protein